MRFDLGTLDSGERSLPFGLLVSSKHHVVIVDKQAMIRTDTIEFHILLQVYRPVYELSQTAYGDAYSFQSLHDIYTEPQKKKKKNNASLFVWK